MIDKNNNTESVDTIANLVTSMKEDGYNFDENPAIFKWSLDAHPELNFTLMIKNNLVGGIFDPEEAPTLQ